MTYRYGLRGVWLLVRASSEREIVERYPELNIVHDAPQWLTDERRAMLMDAVEDADEPGSFLRRLIAGRDDPEVLKRHFDPEPS